MVEFQEKCHVTAIEQLADDVFRLSLHAPAIAGVANPGQFVMVRVTDQFDPLLRRPFSLHSLTSDGISLLFKVVGKGTAMLANGQINDLVDLVGPLGQGFAIGDRDGAVCLIGGGMGIAPLLFLAQRLARLRHPMAADRILLGARNKEEIDSLVCDFSELGYTVQVATDDGSLGHHGFVPDLLADVLPQVTQVYSCGPHVMMKTIAAQCERVGVRCQVSLEAHMACGLGACLGCTVEGPEGLFIHVCKQGPVFDSREVKW